MTTTPGGRDAVCQRTACTETGPADHVGGAHLNPRDRARFDGPDISHAAVAHTVRDAVTPLLVHAHALGRARREHPDTVIRELVDLAITACYNHIYFLGDQVAHLMVSKDHAVRDAMRRAEDCTEHGADLTAAYNQTAAISDAGDRTERARLALLGEHQAIADLLSAHDGGRLKPDLTVADLIAALRKTNTATSAAHDRAYRPRRTRPQQGG